jgi:hypothetical protein
MQAKKLVPEPNPQLVFWWCPHFEVARLALRDASGRSATRATKLGRYRRFTLSAFYFAKAKNRL